MSPPLSTAVSAPMRMCSSLYHIIQGPAVGGVVLQHKGGVVLIQAHVRDAVDLDVLVENQLVKELTDAATS